MSEHTHTCARCGTPFTPKAANQKYHTNGCAHEARRDREAGYTARPSTPKTKAPKPAPSRGGATFTSAELQEMRAKLDAQSGARPGGPAMRLDGTSRRTPKVRGGGRHG